MTRAELAAAVQNAAPIRWQAQAGIQILVWRRRDPGRWLTTQALGRRFHAARMEVWPTRRASGGVVLPLFVPAVDIPALLAWCARHPDRDHPRIVAVGSLGQPSAGPPPAPSGVRT